MTKQQTQRALINIEYKVAKPFVDATALGLAIGGPSAFSGNFWGGFVCGTTFSLFWYWGSTNLTRPKKSKAKGGGAGSADLIINSATGSRKISRFEYAPGYVSRETPGETLRRLLPWGRPEPRLSATSTPKPRWMTEFIFYGQYNGQEMQLLEIDVTRFLNAAWRYRKRGRGLSERHWVKNISERPQWYKNTGPGFYYALVDLLWEVEAMSGRQLIVPVGWQQNALARDPHQTLEALRWAQGAKGNVQPDIPNIPQADELIIGSDGASSFEV